MKIVKLITIYTQKTLFKIVQKSLKQTRHCFQNIQETCFLITTCLVISVVLYKYSTTLQCVTRIKRLIRYMKIYRPRLSSYSLPAQVVSRFPLHRLFSIKSSFSTWITKPRITVWSLSVILKQILPNLVSKAFYFTMIPYPYTIPCSLSYMYPL